MLQLLVVWYRLVAAIWRGVRDDETFRGLVIAVVLLLAGGTAFYVGIEGWTIVDGLYFSVMTLATVGFGDLAPVTVLGKLFTVGYVLFGVGLLAAFITELGRRRWPARTPRPTSAGEDGTTSSPAR